MDMPATPVISPETLAEHLGSDRVVIVDCRFSLQEPQQGHNLYRQAHIPGAYYLDLNRDLSSAPAEHGGRHPLPDPARLADRLGGIGVHSGTGDADTLVVAYDDNRQAFAARLWWLLRYLGHDNVAVLDGGFKAWRERGLPVDAETPVPEPATFVPRPRRDRVVDIDYVRPRANGAGVLVDAREEDRYLGIREPIDPVAGHIPGAVNYPWPDATTADGFVLSPEMHKRRWKELQDADDIVVYCGSGVTACVDLLSMAIAGIEHAKLYAGSWSDWCSYRSDTV